MGLSSIFLIAHHCCIGLGMQILQSWARPGLQELHILAGTIQHFQNAISEPLGSIVAKDLCQREGFHGGPFWGYCCLSAAPCLLSCKGT